MGSPGDLLSGVATAHRFDASRGAGLQNRINQLSTQFAAKTGEEDQAASRALRRSGLPHRVRAHHEHPAEGNHVPDNHPVLPDGAAWSFR